MITQAKIPHHRRSEVFEVYEAGPDAVQVVGHLIDERPWATGERDLPVVHDIELIITVGLADLTVRAVEVGFHVYPHAECTAIAAAYQQLVGLTIGRGWVNSMRERLGGPAGCTHLRELARAMAPVLLQAAFSARMRAAAETGTDAGEREPDPQALAMLPLLTGTCHIWAEGGIAARKLDLGWRPGTTAYPVPALAELSEQLT